MKKFKFPYVTVALFSLVSVFLICWIPAEKGTADKGSEPVPSFQVDPLWPKPLPNDWLIGQVAGVAVDSKDHVWIVHRPGSLGADEYFPAQEPASGVPYVPAPPVIEFDGEGNVVQAWGGPGEGYEWPQNPHGIFIDHQENVWIGGSGANDHQVLKFRPDGKFLMQIGNAGETGGSNDTKLLGRPAEFDVDPGTNEVYIADGYLNRRIIVFNAGTGEYLRHWGAYGKAPDDSPQDAYDPSESPSPQYRTPVHAVLLSRDGLVYVCDRKGDRIQVFQKNGKYLKEVIISGETMGNGTAWDIDFSPDPQQTYMYVTDGTNQRVWIMHRENLEVMGYFGRIGRYPGQFIWLHSLAVDSRGNIYTTEVYTGKRVQKFTYQGAIAQD